MSDPLEVPKSVNQNLEYQKRLNTIQAHLLGLPHIAAVNILATLMVDIVGQMSDTSNQAEATYDELTGKAKQFLLSRYSSVTGRRARPDGDTILRIH